MTLNFIVILKTEPRINTPEDTDKLSENKYDCILVLGAGVKPDGTPSHMLEDRLITAVNLYQSGISDTILMSGDHHTENYDEVGAMKAYAIKMGVPESAIVCDDYGLSTYESIYRAKNVFGYNKAVVITQTYHLYRALYLSDALDLEAVGVSAERRSYAPQFIYDCREMLARCKDFVYSITKPEIN